MRERVIALVDDLVIHRAVKLRMRMQHHRDRRVLLLGRMITAFEAACGTGENDFRHWDPLAKSTAFVRASTGAFTDEAVARIKGADQASSGLSQRRSVNWRPRSSMRRGAKSKHLEHLAVCS